MVEIFSSWAKNLTIVIVVISVLEMILPNNKTKKYIKSIFGLFVVLNIIAPFVGQERLQEIQEAGINSLSIENAKVEENESMETSTMVSKIENIYIIELEKDISNNLVEQGYNVDKINVQVALEEEVKITNIELELSKEKATKVEENANGNENVTSSLEQKIEVVIDKIKPINIEKKENQTEESMNDLTATDIEKISEFLIEEYGVNKECLKIKSSY